MIANLMFCTLISQSCPVLHSYLTAYANKDLQTLMNLFSDTALVHWGTGKDERMETIDQVKSGLERDFAQGERVRFDVVFENTKTLGEVKVTVAEVAAYLTNGGAEKPLPTLRMTMVSHEGKIIHMHVSWPFAQQEEGQSFVSGA